MHWPTAQDYNEAVQCPDLSFDDAELKGGSVELTPLGLPKVACGNFAGVYRLICGNRSYAVKCFLRNVYDQHQRYAQLTQFTAVTGVPHMVDFQYQLKGIFVEGNWFPIVKMEWVNGVGLDQFLRKNWSNKLQIDRVIAQFAELVRGLKQAGMAHGDLQHGNVLVRNDALKLVDYDGMFVPLMNGLQASELGHPNYQHPARTSKDFGAKLDDFSAWVIYYSLLFLKLDPSLWQRFEGGDDCLIFRKSDFADSGKSRILADLSRHPIPEIRSKLEHLLAVLNSPIDRVPKFALEAQGGVTAQAQRNGSALTTGSGVGASPGSLDATQELARVRWPKADAYYKALLTPTKSLLDDNLNKCLLCRTYGKTGSELDVDAGELSLEKAVINGRRHAVFRLALIDGSRYYAVKCFLRPQSDRQARWSEIKKHNKPNSNRYFTQFLYLPRGIVASGETLPILKMLWVDGETMDRYVARHLKIGFLEPIEALSYKFREMMQALAADGIAHGDLEPSNILVDLNGDLKLLDYDGMYVPSLAHLQASETGNPSYQHPNRNLSNFGPYLDNFSAMVIDGILACMVANPPEPLHNWEALLQYLKQRPDTHRSHQPQAGQKRGGPILGSYGSPFQPPTLDSWAPTAQDCESKFETLAGKLSRSIKEMHKYRLDLVPPLSAVRQVNL